MSTRSGKGYCSNVFPCVERRPLSRDMLMDYPFKDSLVQVYEDIVDDLLFYSHFSTGILVPNVNYRGVGHPVARFTDAINCRFSCLPQLKSYQPNISDFED